MRTRWTRGTWHGSTKQSASLCWYCRQWVSWWQWKEWSCQLIVSCHHKQYYLKQSMNLSKHFLVDRWVSICLWSMIDTNSTVFVLHYWTLSTGHSTDGPRTAPGVDRQLLEVTNSSWRWQVVHENTLWRYSGGTVDWVPRLTEWPSGVVILQCTVWRYSTQ
jgi:hypothetical protein